MNIILFETSELKLPLLRSDPRYRHLLKVLKCHEGDSFNAGITNGPIGKAIIRKITDSSIKLDFNFKESLPEELYPVTLVVGMARPQTVRKILQDATALGVCKICFAGTDKGEKSYFSSRLWTTDEYKKYVKLGAEQAFCTRLPEIKLYYTLSKCITDMAGIKDNIVLDNYESTISLKDYKFKNKNCALFIGPERGWSDKERDFFREKEFTIAGLGRRILRIETACVSSVSLVLAGLGLI